MFPRWLVYVVVVHGVLGTSNTILEAMLNAVSVPLQSFFNESIHAHYSVVLDSQGMSLVVSFMSNMNLVGFIFALFFVVPQMDSRGRRFLSVHVLCLIVILSASCFVIAKYANSIEVFATAQFVLGFAQALKMIVVKIYLGECVSDQYRAFITHALGSCLIVTSLLATVLYHPSRFGTADSWQFVPMMCVGMEVLYFCLAAWLPESPKWLIDVGRPKEEVVEAIRFYHGNSENIDQVMEDIREEIQLTAHSRMSVTDVCRSETFRSVFIILFMAVLTSTLSMVTITQNYTQKLLLDYGFSIDNNDLRIFLFVTVPLMMFSMLQYFLFIGILQVSAIPLLILNPYLYERLGRRPMFLFTSLCSLLTTILFLLAQMTVDLGSGSSTASIVLGMLAIILNVLAASTGLVASFVVFISDLLPPGAKVSVTQILLFTSLAIQIPAIFLFGNLLTAVGFWTFVPFCVIQITICFYMFLYLPETKERSVASNVHTLQDQLHIKSRSRSSSTATESTSLISRRISYGSET